jgi:hypothetical protein
MSVEVYDRERNDKGIQCRMVLARACTFVGTIAEFGKRYGGNPEIIR